MTHFHPFLVDAGELQALVPAAAGAGVAAWLEARLLAAGATFPGGLEVSGELRLAADWRAAITLTAPALPQPARREEAAALAQPHHLFCRLLEFAALTLGVSLSEPILLACEDLRTSSPGALLEFAAGNLMRAIELDPAFAAPRIALARQLAAQGQAPAAAGLLEGVTVADSAAAAELGLAFWAAGLDGIAMALLPAALADAHAGAIAHAALAVLLSRHGGEEGLAEAVPLATRATELGGNDYRCWAALAEVHRAAGRFDQAAFFYGMALRLEPDAPSVLKDAAATWLLARQPDKALPLIERALAQSAQDPDHYGNLAFARNLQGRAPEALAAAQRAVELRPADARLHVLHGEMALAAGDREAALEAWARATELDSTLVLNPEGGNLGVTHP